MLPESDGHISYYLMPGEFYLGSEPAVVQTVLGSCLSITMYDRSRKVGGMCHCILPCCPSGDSCTDFCEEGFRFVGCSVRGMLKKFRELGIRDGDIEVKLFGGADMLERHGGDSIGKQNIDAALAAIRAEGLKLAAFDVGETAGRKIFFYTDTGEVYLKRLQKTAPGLSPKY